MVGSKNKKIMKKLLILLLTVVSLSSYGFINNSTRYLLFDAEKVQELLKIDDSIEIMIVYLPKHVEYDIFTKDHLKGTVCPSVNGKYVIFLSSELSDTEAENTLIHEMTHISQIIDGRLEYISGNHVRWKGNSYHKVRYNSPWEVEAEKITSIVKSRLKCRCK